MTEDRTIQFIKDVLLNGNDPRGKEAEKNLRWGLNEYLKEKLTLNGVSAKEQKSIKEQYLSERKMELCVHPPTYARKYGSMEICEKCGKTWG